MLHGAHENTWIRINYLTNNEGVKDAWHVLQHLGSRRGDAELISAEGLAGYVQYLLRAPTY